MHGAHEFLQGPRDRAVRGGGHDGRLPAAAPAGRARLPPRRAHRRPARADPAGRRPGDRPDALRARRHPADVLARARVQPAQAVPGRAHRRAHRGHPVQPHDLARLRGGPGLRLDARCESIFAGRDHRHLQHHHHRQGVRRAGHPGQAARARGRRPHRRGPDRHPADGDAHRASPPAAGCPPSALALDGGPAGRVPRRRWSWSACSSCRASCASIVRLEPAGDDARGRASGICFARRAAGARRSATRWRSARSSPARWSPSRARRSRSSTWSSRCATCSRRSSSSRSAC